MAHYFVERIITEIYDTWGGLRLSLFSFGPKLAMANYKKSI